MATNGDSQASHSQPACWAQNMFSPNKTESHCERCSTRRPAGLSSGPRWIWCRWKGAESPTWVPGLPKRCWRKSPLSSWNLRPKLSDDYQMITANLSQIGWFHVMRTGKFIDDSTDVNHDSPKEWKFNVSKSGWYWLVVDLLVSSQVSWHQNHFKALFGLGENNSNVNPSEIIDVHWDKKCLR